MTQLEQDLADAGMPPISTFDQVCTALSATPKVVYAMNANGLPRWRVGVSLRYSRREVAAYLETMRRGGEPAGATAARSA